MKSRKCIYSNVTIVAISWYIVYPCWEELGWIGEGLETGSHYVTMAFPWLLYRLSWLQTSDYPPASITDQCHHTWQESVSLPCSLTQNRKWLISHNVILSSIHFGNIISKGLMPPSGLLEQLHSHAYTHTHAHTDTYTYNHIINSKSF